MRRTDDDRVPSQEPLLNPMDIKRLARVPYATVIGWLAVGPGWRNEPVPLLMDTP